MLCTDGANPVRAVVDWQPGLLEFLPIRQFRPIDPCGCGDQFAATFGLALAAIRSWPRSQSPVSSSPLGWLPLAIQLAQLAAGLQTQRIGATPIRAAELLDEIDRVEED
jgi:sugar/nucleoside kinase (ribokinase family)